MEKKYPKIEIYGIPETVSRCAGCSFVKLILKDLGIPYTFIDVLSPSKNSLGFTYDREMIVKLAERAKFPSLNIRYPVIFVDDVHIKNIRLFKEHLIELGYDKDIVED